ncbi:efflux RND transporter periplasmic adaptor subunit [Gallaecimonas mangrovi]|uniref:efflux RND transporter periplasmic adaptor subunit n=1 Tax=Gallaecimonas mangrovi TaxID=2291597 RepID=UPI000E202797|nr:efflux RND transporter periplasmic adaptor subunit [Gallaecimonas mangrovi]
MTKLTLLSGLLALTCTLAACQDQKSEHHSQAKIEVGVVTLKATTIPLDTELQGRLTASLSSDVRPQVSGIIEKRLFTEGSQVKKGQLLYQLDPATYQAAYDQAKANLLNAQATVTADKLKDERYQSLLQDEGVSKQDADDAHATYLAAKASVASYQAAVESARIDLDRTKIKAPISGFIGISSYTPGALVTADQDDALATIRALNPIYVDLTQSSKELLKLRKTLDRKTVEKGTAAVTLTLEDDSTYPLQGKLQMKEVSVNESTGSVTLRAEFPNPNGVLLPGMFVRAKINEAVDKKGILAPQQGVIRDNDGSAHAWLAVDGKAKRVEVVTEQAIGDKWVVSSGLHDGDKLIVEGTDKVTNGDAVNAVAVKLDSSTGGQ